MKERFAAAARCQARHGIGAAQALRGSGAADRTTSSTGDDWTVEPVPIDRKITVRLRTDDLLLLRERAKARVMPTSTYVSLLIRSHLRALTPLPTAELEALKRSVAEVSAIGRNLNQIARAAE